MAAGKTLFAPVPLRAMASELSGLQMRVLVCIASHDRMSLVTGKGQGCRASNDRMHQMIGCSYAKLCSALSFLTDAGFLQREKLGRHTVYRIVYTDDDRCLFGNTSPAPTCDQTGNQDAPIGYHDFPETRTNQPEMTSQYIPLNGGIHSVETGEDNSPEGARLSPRIASGKALFRDREPINESLAKFERQWKQDWTLFRPNLDAWRDWLWQTAEQTAGDDNTASGRAQRLAETVENWMDYVAWENGDEVDL